MFIRNYSRLLIGSALLMLFPLCTFAQAKLETAFLSIVRKKFEMPLTCRSAGCICSIPDETVAVKLLSEYGGIFAAGAGVSAPTRCIFYDEHQVSQFQASVGSQTANIAGTVIELQTNAMEALLDARSEATKADVRLTPLDGSIAGKRSYSDTIRIWNSRFLRALNHWAKQGRISSADAEIARRDEVLEQIRKVMLWEKDGMNFGTNLKGSIFSSTAPPGTSQHLSMLAFDVVQYSDSQVRSVLNKHGWFQTVASDPPHFTYLGVDEGDLPSRGLKTTIVGGYRFWVPSM